MNDLFSLDVSTIKPDAANDSQQNITLDTNKVLETPKPLEDDLQHINSESA